MITNEDEPENDSNFRDMVIGGLAELKAQNVMILSRLEKLDSAMKVLDQKTNCLDIAFTAHPLNCPVRGKVEKLERELETGNHPGSKQVEIRITAIERALADQRVGATTSQMTSQKWLTTLMPLLKLVAIGILLLFALHSKELLPVIQKTLSP